MGRPVVNCSVVGFNLLYVTLAVGVIGVSFYRRVQESSLQNTYELLVKASWRSTDWDYPFRFFLTTSMLPLAVSTVAFLLALVWTSLIRPMYWSHVKSVACKEVTSVLFVLLMMAYTGMLMPGPLVAVEYSNRFDNNSYMAEIMDDMKTLLSTEPYYESPAGPHNYTLAPLGFIMDKIQKTNHCCGIRHHSDYTAQFERVNLVPLPYTCCEAYQSAENDTVDWASCGYDLECRETEIGCSNYIFTLIKRRLAILDGAGFCSVAISAISAILSVILAVFNIWIQTKHERERKKATFGKARNPDQRT